jgi:hypothetical protein
MEARLVLRPHRQPVHIDGGQHVIIDSGQAVHIEKAITPFTSTV